MGKAIKNAKAINPIVPPSRVSLRLGGSEEESKVDQGDGQHGLANAGSGGNPPIVPPEPDQIAPPILPPSRNPPPSSNPPRREVVWEPGLDRQPYSVQDIKALSDEGRTRLFDLMEANAFTETFEQDFGEAEQDWYEYVLGNQLEVLKQKEITEKRRATRLELLTNRNLLAERIHNSERIPEPDQQSHIQPTRSRSVHGSRFGDDLDDAATSLGGLSIRNEVLDDANRGMITVIDMDGDPIKVALKQSDFDKKKPLVTVAMRLCDEIHFSSLLGASLDLSAAKVRQLFSQSVAQRAYMGLFPASSTFRVSGNDLQSRPGFPQGDVCMDVGLLADLPAIKDKDVLEVVCGISEWKDGVFTLSKFHLETAGRGAPEWGGRGFNVIKGALENLSMFLCFIFGHHMKALTDSFVHLMDVRATRIFCDPHPEVVVYLFNLLLKMLWQALRITSADAMGVPINLKDSGWCTIVNDFIGGIVFDANNVNNILNITRSQKPVAAEKSVVHEAKKKRSSVEMDSSPQGSPRVSIPKKSKPKDSGGGQQKSMCIAHCAYLLRIKVNNKVADLCKHGSACSFEHDLSKVNRNNALKMLRNPKVATNLITSVEMRNSMVRAFEIKYPSGSAGAGSDGDDASA